uniref:Sulfatase N-terminal domain-containing protein n=1 Tax=Alexandrium monilatum TaxID=311494 RepID=A0A7S4SNS5_9DINO
MFSTLSLIASFLHLGVHGQAPKPHLIFILQDDLGRFDTAIYGNKAAEAATHNITSLAREGVVLSNHYVHWHCSPTRRSFLTGRLPLHHTEKLSGLDTDDIDLRWAWISEKLRAAGYVSHWYGKGHTGYRSMNHLPARRGFNGGSLLFFTGAGSYTTLPRWSGEGPVDTKQEYSTDLFGSLAVRAVRDHDPAVPLFLYLPFQAVHTPYDLPPDRTGAECPSNIACMLQDADRWVGELVLALKEKGMYENTLIVYSSDNGGVTDGNNYPLRGEKHTNWQGAMRVAAFVSGGYVPKAVRGTTNDGVFHVVDWYPTFAGLAGVDGSDDPPVPPLPVDPQHPDRDIYQGGLSYPPVDGKDIWPQVASGSSTTPHPCLWLSAEVLLKGKYKLLVAQPSPELMFSQFVNNGWKLPNGTWVDAPDGLWPCNAYQRRSHFVPCLFDVDADPREEHNLAAEMPELVSAMWAELNRTSLTAYSARSPERLLGICHPLCALGKWGGTPGPVCGVPGCEWDTEGEVVV